MADIRVDIELKSGDGVYSVDGSRINSVKSLTQSNSDANSIFYGVVPNTGSVDISDVNGEIRKLIEDDIIDYSDVKFDIFAKDNKIASHTAKDSEYEDDLLNTTLGDELSNLSTHKYINPSDANCLSSVSGLSLLNLICVMSKPKLKMPSQYGVVPDNNGTMGVYEYLNSIKFKDIDLKLSEKNSLELLNEFCSATQTNIYVGNDGKPRISMARPICSGHSNSSLRSKGIFIPKKYIYENRPKSLFLKNKIKRVEMSVDKLSVEDLSVRNLTTDPLNLEEFQKKAFFESDDIQVGEGLDTSNAIYEDEKYYVFSKTISSNGYIYINPSEYTVGYYAPENTAGYQFYYILDYGSAQNKFVLENHSSVEDFVTKLNNHLSKVDYETARLSYPVMCGFLNSDMTRSRNEYTIVYAIMKSALEKNKMYRFFILPKPNERTVGPHGGGWTQVERKKYIKTTNTAEITGSGDIKSSESVKLSTGTLLTDNSTILLDKEMSLIDYLGENIICDYSKGLKTKIIQIMCGDLYYSEQKDKLAIKWEDGGLLDVGDIVQIEEETYKDGSYINWKITGREFIFDGAPMLNLELQECVKTITLNDYMYGLFDGDERIYSWNELINKGLVTTENTTLTKVSSTIGGRFLIPQYITSVGERAFAGCYIYGLELGDKLSFIGTSAFAMCWFAPNATIKLPSSVGTIAPYAFSSLRTDTGGKFNIELNEGLLTIDRYAFADVQGLTSIKIPSTVTRINMGCFSGTNIESIEFENPNGWRTTDTGVSLNLSDPVANVQLLTSTYVGSNIAIY